MEWYCFIRLFYLLTNFGYVIPALLKEIFAWCMVYRR